ncbi:hypothetical protein F4805DRAFT_414333 [Annulohypoxylon moriforme]|nr:hypothetical protein F4805DRAFT_414333 [Annulohypoxylon moriforme]
MCCVLLHQPKKFTARSSFILIIWSFSVVIFFVVTSSWITVPHSTCPKEFLFWTRYCSNSDSNYFEATKHTALKNVVFGGLFALQCKHICTQVLGTAYFVYLLKFLFDTHICTWPGEIFPSVDSFMYVCSV